MATEPKKTCSISCIVKPVNKYNVLFHYVPMKSLVSYGVLSVNMMNPTLAARLCRRDLTSYLLVSSIFGTSLYIYSRPHLRELQLRERASYSICGGSLFTFASVLIWALIRSTLRPDQKALSTILGLGSGVLITKLGYDYLKHVDSLVPAKAIEN